MKKCFQNFETKLVAQSYLITLNFGSLCVLFVTTSHHYILGEIYSSLKKALPSLGFAGLLINL